MRALELRGARTHNLKAIDLTLYPGELVGLCGVSGAGKSSLATHTLYAEGQRRYVESFSAYARQFLERKARPDVDRLEPVPVGIAVARQGAIRTRRSTVATLTDLADFVKTLWARIAALRCGQCGAVVRSLAPEEVAKEVLAQVEGERIAVSYPLRFAAAEEFETLRDDLVREGYRRVMRGGNFADLEGLGADARELSSVPPGPTGPDSAATRQHANGEGQLEAAYTLDVVADRTVARAGDLGRLTEAIEASMRRGGGRADVWRGNERLRFSSGLHCARCDIAYPRAQEGLFSFNSPMGACPTCRGFGAVMEVDYAKVIPDHRKSLNQGAVRAWLGKAATWERSELKRCAKAAGIPLDRPVSEFSEAQWAWLLDGEEGGYDARRWMGLRAWFRWIEGRSYRMHVRVFLARYRSYATCSDCGGTRFKNEALRWRLGGTSDDGGDDLSVADFYNLEARQANELLAVWQERYSDNDAARVLLEECRMRVRALVDVGLGYLTLGRPGYTLSGGEAQRVALTTALGASLGGSLFVVEEPTAGLHPRDTNKVLEALQRLRDAGNAVVVVEHDEELLAGVDRLVELGPGGGEAGGTVVYDGTPAGIAAAGTATAAAFTAEPCCQDDGVGEPDCPSAYAWLRLQAPRGHNLRLDEVAFPQGQWTCVTGVSGSGKSSLVTETLAPALAQALGHGDTVGKSSRQRLSDVLPHGGLSGFEGLRAVLLVDQSPLSRTSRANPATYCKAWDTLRKRFAAESLAKERGYGPSFFSLNVDGGRCLTCRGEGAETVEMQFLADVRLTCPACAGRRFAGPVLDVRHRGFSIADVLALSVEAAAEHFGDDRELVRRLAPLRSLGLNHLQLGQPLSMLSGGETQRIKLASALGDLRGPSVVILDEPTAGLHRQNIGELVGVIRALVAQGHTVITVEHDMRFALAADHLIDVGPGAGPEGGLVVAAGRPMHVALGKGFTANALQRALHPPLTEKSAGNRAHRNRTANRTQPKSTPPKGRLQRVGAEPIRVIGAREHNLRGIEIDIPREKLVVLTGPSGSGKSSLAFNVVYAEAQRRYLETLSPYVRQYLPQLARPQVDRIDGLPPAVALEQRMTRGGSKSTVATMTEVAHYLRLLMARAGTLYCPDCDLPVEAQSNEQALAQIQARFPKRKGTLFAPVVRNRKGAHRKLLNDFRLRGFEEARIDGKRVPLKSGLSLDRYAEHRVELKVAEGKTDAPDFAEALARTLKLGTGTAVVLGMTNGPPDELLVSTERSCPGCGTSLPEADPRFFSFNAGQGACAICEGRGRGDDGAACTACNGSRLAPLARHARLGVGQGRTGESAERGVRLPELFALSCDDALDLLRDLRLEGWRHEVGGLALEEARKRLGFVVELGLGYLELGRSADTLSGGEAQRVRLAGQLGSGLTGLLYVLDEPTIGLHPRDTQRLIDALRSLVDQGTSVVVVEHDEDTLRAADHLIDMGPGGGSRGGNILAQGTPKQLMRSRTSITGRELRAPFVALRARLAVDKKTPRLSLRGATAHNLKNIDISVPLGRLTTVTGVSGSGKSTLVRQVLLPALRRELGLVAEEPRGTYCGLEGTESLKRAVEVDQSPIGRTPRSVPATYLGIWNAIRQLLAGTPEARARGFKAGRFSFNAGSGRCGGCDGQGSVRHEMAFLPDVDVRCEVCEGRRFNPETLRVAWHGYHAGALLDLEIDAACQVFAAVPRIAQPLQWMCDLGLGYLRLGQPSNTLSGGEAQRLKLVAELASTTGQDRSLYVLDEPSTGLHKGDVARLARMLERFVERGDTVLLIEHQPDLIHSSDWLIDLGPEAGRGGGEVVASCTPDELAGHPTSHTGAMLRRLMRVSCKQGGQNRRGTVCAP